MNHPPLKQEQQQEQHIILLNNCPQRRRKSLHIKATICVVLAVVYALSYKWDEPSKAFQDNQSFQVTRSSIANNQEKEKGRVHNSQYYLSNDLGNNITIIQQQQQQQNARLNVTPSSWTNNNQTAFPSNITLNQQSQLRQQQQYHSLQLRTRTSTTRTRGVGSRRNYRPSTTKTKSLTRKSSDVSLNDKIRNHAIVLERYKLIFFFTPKVASSIFKKLFRRIMGYHNWLTISPHSPKINGLTYLNNYTTQQATEMMHSSIWTKAVFIRNPKKRLLSAYLNKVIKDKGFLIHVRGCSKKKLQRYPSLRHVCKQVVQSRYNKNVGPDFPPSFYTFGHDVTKVCSDPHWAPQSPRIDDKHWPYINFIGYFESIEQDTTRLLKQIDAWDDYGKSGWGPYGNESIFANNYARHKTSAEDIYQDYYNNNPKLNDYVVSKLYQVDYAHPAFSSIYLDQ